MCAPMRRPHLAYARDVRSLTAFNVIIGTPIRLQMRRVSMSSIRARRPVRSRAKGEMDLVNCMLAVLVTKTDAHDADVSASTRPVMLRCQLRRPVKQNASVVASMSTIAS